jgi:hypothetical protein
MQIKAGLLFIDLCSMLQLKIMIRSVLIIFAILTVSNTRAQSDAALVAAGLDSTLEYSESSGQFSFSGVEICDSTIFYLSDLGVDSIHQFRLNGDSIEYLGTLHPVLYYHLASAKMPSLGIDSVQFLDLEDDKFWTYNQEWLATTANFWYSASGIGAHNDVVFLSWPTNLHSWDNGIISSDLNDGDNLRVADVAVDSLGRGWYFTGTNIYFANQVKVIESDGTLIGTYTFEEPLNTDNGFGTFFMNGKLYVGLGNSNAVHTNVIAHIELLNNTATLGQTYPLPISLNWMDAASCFPGVLIEDQPIDESAPEPQIGLGISPNPSSDYVMVNAPYPSDWLLTIRDLDGRICIANQFHGNAFRPNLQSVHAGIYIVELRDELSGKYYSLKWVKTDKQ